MEYWKGELTYDTNHRGEDKAVAFELQVDLIDQQFNGIAVDSEFKKVCEVPVKVRGSVEGDFIRFVAKYPFMYYETQLGQIILDRDSPGHQVSYEGYFDPTLEKWTGDWEIDINSESSFQGAKNEDFLGGVWELEIPSIQIP